MSKSLKKIIFIKNKGKELILQSYNFDKRILIFTYDVLALFAAMQLSMWFVMKEELPLLSSDFVFKQSCIFAFIASGFFLWFQTYRGVWRYLSWRQSVLIMGVLGFASLIFFPLVTKVHMEPIPIPNLVVLVNWGMASILLIGSRLFFRVFYERWLSSEDSGLADTPVSRVILVGSGHPSKNFLRQLGSQKQYLYDVIGIVDSNPKVGESIEGVEILGSLSDLPDLIENFNSEGMHPHHIVMTEPSYLDERVRFLLTSLSPFKVDFMKLCAGEKDLVPLTVEDIFYEATPPLSLEIFSGKSLLIYGATCPLGQEFVKCLSANRESNKARKIILWDQNVHALSHLKKSLEVKGSQDSLTFLSKNSYANEQLVAYLKQESVDIFINLKAFSAAITETLDPSLSFETYVEENESFSKIAQQAGVKNYFFITQQAPHWDLATRLVPLSHHILKDRSNQSNLTHAMVNMPYILHQEDPFFQGHADYQLSQNTLLVTTPSYGAYILAATLEIVLEKNARGVQDIKSTFKMENISYQTLAKFYSILNHQGDPPVYKLEEKEAPSILWDEDIYGALKQSLSLMEYKKAGECLERLYPV